MTILSKRFSTQFIRAYRGRYGIKPWFITEAGEVVDANPASAIHALPGIRQARAYALAESLRWGEPYTFFLAPGIISWVIPLVNEGEVHGGVIGGEVVAEDEPEDRREAVMHLTDAGSRPEVARDYVDKLPVWTSSKTQEAADYLYSLFYQMSGWTPMLLKERRDLSRQQQKIAEEVHRLKKRKSISYPLDDERMLISLIRAGDRSGARGVLNRMLGAIFLKTANLAVVRALTIEMMGYLVRTAVEDSPYLEPLLEKNHEWMAHIIEAPDFEALSAVLRNALDDFMNNIYLRGYTPTHSSVEQARTYILDHYKESVALQDVAEACGLSTYRIAHLVKEHTGKTILQHVHRMRIQEARKLLEETSLSCADIAYEVGFGDQSYFTKQFRVVTGITPAKYRQRCR